MAVIQTPLHSMLLCIVIIKKKKNVKVFSLLHNRKFWEQLCLKMATMKLLLWHMVLFRSLVSFQSPMLFFMNGETISSNIIPYHFNRVSFKHDNWIKQQNLFCYISTANNWIFPEYCFLAKTTDCISKIIPCMFLKFKEEQLA